MKYAITKAIEGGWKGLEFYDEIQIDKYRLVDIHRRVWGTSKLGEGHGTTVAQIVLDPAFWQALGKSMGWLDHTLQAEVNNRCWKCRWHRFIDHLALGKDVDSFFTELLTNTK